MNYLPSIKESKKAFEKCVVEIFNSLSPKQKVCVCGAFGFGIGIGYFFSNMSVDYTENVTQSFDKDGNVIQQTRNVSRHINSKNIEIDN